VTAALRLVPSLDADRVVIDGSLEQADEIALVVAHLRDHYERIRNDYGFAVSVLAEIMRAAKQRRLVAGGFEFELRTPSPAWWCTEHEEPPALCARQHPEGEPISVHPVPLDPYLRVKRLGGHDDHS
jgi:hypothetical protein